MEIWKDIKGYEGRYQVSNLGRVKSLDRIIERNDGRSYKHKGRIMKSCHRKDGYFHVQLGSKKFLTHRLVAMMFIINNNNYKEVNHIDGNKINNNVKNLEWSTRSKNVKHAFNIGLRSHQGIKNTNCKLTEKQVKEIKKELKHYKLGMFTELGRKYNVYYSTISAIHSGKRWSHI